LRHPSEQDLLLLGHRSLGMLRSLSAQIHIRSCPECQAKYARILGVSSLVAKAVRPGLPAWKPMGMTIGAKIAIGALIAVASIGTAEIAVNVYDASLQLPPITPRTSQDKLSPQGTVIGPPPKMPNSDIKIPGDSPPPLPHACRETSGPAGA
jgi:hypothetical protein